MKRIVELAAASLPWAIRDRYLEEWLHDLEHAAEAGVRTVDVAWGAVRTVITADRLAAPTAAHAVLQARLRIDGAGVHGSIAMMLTIFSWYSLWGWPPDPVAMLLLAAAAVHLAIMFVQLALASVTLGSRVRWPIVAWALSLAIGGGAGVILLAGGVFAWWMWLATAGCLVTATILLEGLKPPKPELHEQLPPESRRRLVRIGLVIGASTLALALLDLLVLVPLRRHPGASLGEAWRAIEAARGASQPLADGALVAGLMIVPIAFGLLGAAWWARSERGVLGWAANGAFAAVLVAYSCGASFAASDAGAPWSNTDTVILPLIAGFLVHFTMRVSAELAPLPPASVPLPPGPWHTDLEPTTSTDRPHPAGG